MESAKDSKMLCYDNMMVEVQGNEERGEEGRGGGEKRATESTRGLKALPPLSLPRSLSHLPEDAHKILSALV